MVVYIYVAFLYVTALYYYKVICSYYNNILVK